ncbi:MAG: ATP-dependent DNA helicase DinG [Spongiibacteraceae bacterium]
MLTDELKQTIQHAYRRWLEAKGLKARYGQRLMVAEVARTLAEAGGENVALAAVEAGTGTGKTMAYSVAAIPVAQALEKTLVIATATVALQEQIVYKDLPDLMTHSGLVFTYALAKGRSRYLCLAKLDNSLASADNNPALALYPDEIAAQPDRAMQEIMQELLDELGSGAWDGDRDHWPRQIPDVLWQRITTDHAQCTGRRCPHVRQCSFFKARDAIDKVDVIITNHDLVLADLALGGGAILPDPADCIYIFDEGHHLPDKARDHFAAASRLRSTDKWLEQSIKLLASAAGDIGTASGADRQLEVMPGIIFELRQALALLRPQIESLADHRSDEFSDHYRFENGLVPEEIREVANTLRSGFEELCERLGRVAAIVEAALDKGDNGISRTTAERWYPVVSLLRARAENNRELFFYFARDAADESPPRARWIAFIENQGGQLDFELNCSPILAAGALAKSLWSRCAGALVTSATLTALGKFDRYKMRSGMPDETNWAMVPSPFNYAEAGLLSVPPMTADPTNPEQHTAMLIEMLPELLNPAEGSLVLFASRRQMNDVYAALAPEWRERILSQDSLGKHELLTRHRACIDGGAGSVIFGLASFAEGVDLPGNYCKHVIIAKIPFAVPDAPVEAALAEWIEARGGNAFMEVAVPDAALKLVQASGRLLRTESDSGRITLLDKRIVSRRYGRAILDSLPPFRREIAR